MRALFHVEFGPAIGLGHLVRSAVLAEELAHLGFHIAFTSRSDLVSAQALLANLGFHLPNLTFPSLDEIKGLEDPFDLAVIDHYLHDDLALSNIEQRCRRLIRIIDMVEQDCRADMLVIPSAHLDMAAIKAKAPAHAQIISGANLALIRRTFRAKRAAAATNDSLAPTIGQVVIAMGGADMAGLSLQWVGHVRSVFPEATITVAIGSVSPHIQALRALLGPNDILAIDRGDMDEILASADLSIGSGGVGLLERCVLGVPNLTIVAAENQWAQVTDLVVAGATKAISADQAADQGTAQAYLRTMAPMEPRASSRAAGLRSVDGRGVQRIIAALMNDGELLASNLRVRLAEATDRDLIFRFQTEPGARTYSRNPAPPSSDEHDLWMARTLADPDRYVFILEHDFQPCGLLRLDPAPHFGPGYEVSILLNGAARGRGIGRVVLGHVAGFVAGVGLWAEIDPANLGSIRSFTHAGFAPVGPRLYRFTRD